MKLNAMTSATVAMLLTIPAIAAAQSPAPIDVLLIGDSISGGYTPTVRELLKERANVVGIQRKIVNGATDNGLEELEAWLGDTKWAVIHFNWGLWDLKVDKSGRNTIPIEQYGVNLRRLIVRMKKSNAKLAFASTTPVPDYMPGGGRRGADVLLYNAVARKICEEEQIAIDDLYAVAIPRLIDIQLPNNVHYTKEGSQVLGKHVAMTIEFLLDSLKPAK